MIYLNRKPDAEERENFTPVVEGHVPALVHHAVPMRSFSGVTHAPNWGLELVGGWYVTAVEASDVIYHFGDGSSLDIVKKRQQGQAEFRIDATGQEGTIELRGPSHDMLDRVIRHLSRTSAPYAERLTFAQACLTMYRMKGLDGVEVILANIPA